MITFVALLLTVSSYAQNVSVSRHSQNRRIQLYSPVPCGEVERQAEALRQWKLSLGEPVAATNLRREDGWCFLDVDGVTPDIIRERYSTFARENGPNCFNTALTAAGVLSHLRHTEANELEFWLTSPLCRTIPRNEVRPGDIISIRDQRGQHVHSFNYISETLAFTKNGFELQQQYNIQKTADVLNAYHTPAYCQTTCTDEYRRCTSIEKYLEEHPFPEEEIRQQWETINQLECQGSDIAMGVSSLSPEIMSLMTSSFDSLEALTEQRSEDSALPPDQRLLWRAMGLKISSLRMQFRLISERPGRR